MFERVTSKKKSVLQPETLKCCTHVEADVDSFKYNVEKLSKIITNSYE